MRSEIKTAIVVEPFEHNNIKYWAGDVIDVQDNGLKNYTMIRHNSESINVKISKAELHDHVFLNQ